MRGQEHAEAPPLRAASHVDTFPQHFADGTTTLVASAGDPSRYAVALRALCAFGSGDDRALVVTTTESADRTVDAYDRLCPAADRPAIRLVDTTASQPSADAIYCESPVVFIPSAGDLERLAIALSDLSDAGAPSSGPRHFVVRSLTPILESTPTGRVRGLIDRTTGLRTGSGLCLLGIDYTKHDDDTVTSLARLTDGVLWVSESTPGRIEFEYRSTT